MSRQPFNPTKRSRIVSVGYFAEMVGVSVSTIKRWITEYPGYYNPSNVKSLAKFIIWLHDTKGFNP